MQSGGFRESPHVYPWLDCVQIFCICRFFVKILWLSDAVPISRDSLTHVHCQFVSGSVLMHTLWTSTAGLSSRPSPSLSSLLALPPQNTCTHLATIFYHRICSPQVSCNPLWCFSAIRVCATWILIKEHCLYLLNIFLRVPQKHERLTPKKDTYGRS